MFLVVSRAVNKYRSTICLLVYSGSALLNAWFVVSLHAKTFKTACRWYDPVEGGKISETSCSIARIIADKRAGSMSTIRENKPFSVAAQLVVSVLVLWLTEAVAEALRQFEVFVSSTLSCLNRVVGMHTPYQNCNASTIVKSMLPMVCMCDVLRG